MNEIVKQEYDSRGNEIYREYIDGFWVKSEYDDHGNETYREFSNGFWIKSEYDENGHETYYETSDGDKWGTPRAIEQEPEIERE